MLQGYPKYISESIKKPKRVLDQINSGKLKLTYFVITIDEGQEQLNIYPSFVLKQKYYQNLPMEIVGLADNYDNALEMVRVMVEDTLAANGNCNIKDYFKSNQGQ